MPGVRVLMYHDIQGVGQASVSSSPYTVSAADFAAQMSTIAEKVGSSPLLFSSLLTGEALEQPGRKNWLITFDDGESGAILAANILEAQGWRGHFFVITDRIGVPGFLDNEQLLDLHRRGHIIGTHSASHPRAMASLPLEDTVTEWRRSCDLLSQLLGEAVSLGAVPGGSYSHTVAAAAAQAGIRLLFTSEPTPVFQKVDGCLVVGRYLVRSSTRSTHVAGLAGSKFLPQVSQATRWRMRNMALAILGRHYYSARTCVLRLVGRR